MRHVIQRHKYKLAFGLPIAILLASTISFSSPNDSVSFEPAKRFLEVGATTTVSVQVMTKTPINAVGGTVVLPPELRLIEASTDDSAVDLWTKEPDAEEGDTTIQFAGGIVAKDGFVGEAEMFRFTVVGQESGKGEILFNEAKILAHDGQGTNVLDTEVPIRFVVRSSGTPSPDLNNDNYISFIDLALVSKKLFGRYDPKYDFNLDGKVTIADIFFLVKKLRD